MPGLNRPGPFSGIHDKFTELMREDPRGFKVIDFVASSPEARRGRRRLAHSSNINHPPLLSEMLVAFSLASEELVSTDCNAPISSVI